MVQARVVATHKTLMCLIKSLSGDKINAKESLCIDIMCPIVLMQTSIDLVFNNIYQCSTWSTDSSTQPAVQTLAALQDLT